MWNSLNPYDSIGYYHNQGLDYFIQNIESLTSNNLEADICDIVADYCTSIGMDSTEIANGVSNSVNLLQSGFNGSTFISSISPNAEVQAFANELLFDIIRDGILVDSLSVYQIIDNIKDWETEVYYYFDLVEDQAILLKASSIARFSLSYWYEVISDPYNIWNQKPGSFQILSTEVSDEYKYAATALSDLFGCLGGGLLGGITASAATATYFWFDEVCEFVGDVLDFFGI